MNDTLVNEEYCGFASIVVAKECEPVWMAVANRG